MPTDVKLNAEGVVKPLDFANALKTAMRHGFDAAAAGETFVDAWTGFTGDETPAIDRIQQALAALDNSKPTPAVGDDGLPTTQRWRTTGKVGDEFVHDADPKGGWVLWTDHVAALAAAHAQHEADVAMNAELARERDAYRLAADYEAGEEGAADVVARVVATAQTAEARIAELTERWTRLVSVADAFVRLINPQLLPAGAEQQREALVHQLDQAALAGVKP